MSKKLVVLVSIGLAIALMGPILYKNRAFFFFDDSVDVEKPKTQFQELLATLDTPVEFCKQLEQLVRRACDGQSSDSCSLGPEKSLNLFDVVKKTPYMPGHVHDLARKIKESYMGFPYLRFQTYNAVLRSDCYKYDYMFAWNQVLDNWSEISSARQTEIRNVLIEDIIHSGRFVLSLTGMSRKVDLIEKAFKVGAFKKLSNNQMKKFDELKENIRFSFSESNRALAEMYPDIKTNFDGVSKVTEDQFTPNSQDLYYMYETNFDQSVSYLKQLDKWSLDGILKQRSKK